LDPDDSQAVYLALLNGGFVTMLRGHSGDDGARTASTSEEVLAASCLSGYPPAVMAKALERLSVCVCAPERIEEAVRTILEAYGLYTHSAKLEHDRGHALVLRFPDQQEPVLLVIDLRSLDAYARDEVIHELDRENCIYLPIHDEGSSTVVVGPVVTPEGPCLRCFDLRRRSNLLYPELERLLASPNASCIRRGHRVVTPVESTLVSACVLGMVLRYATGEQNQANSRRAVFLRVAPAEPRIESGVLFRNPYCEVCGPAGRLPGAQDFSLRQRAPVREVPVS
jgi:bacteriocin biosynthesis cyclodehydratase domain-containing protein